MDNFKDYNESPSLKSVAKDHLGLMIKTVTYIHDIGWNVRPMSFEQLEYAAEDAAVLFKLLDYVQQKKCKFFKKNIVNRKIVHKIKDKKFDWKTPVKYSYSGIFLTEKSRNNLLKMFSTENYSKVTTHGVKLKMALDETLMHIGKHVLLKPIAHRKTDKWNSLLVKSDNDLYALNLSSKANIQPSASTDVDDYELCQMAELEGIVGICVRTINDPLATLSKRLRNCVIKFVNEGSPNQTLTFKPNELSSSERSTIHRFAETHKIDSKSTGKSANRRLNLILRRNSLKYNPDEDQCEETIIRQEKEKDKYHKAPKNVEKFVTSIEEYNMLSLVVTKDNREDVIKDKIGYIMKNDVLLYNDVITSGRVAYILRGLPGSGKSFLAKWIMNKTNGTIVSADHYFINKDGEYVFKKDLLENAHRECYENFKNCIDNDDVVIVDNTNVNKHHYKHYCDYAKAHKFTVRIIEIPTVDQTRCKLFHSRCTHGVPLRNMFRMMSQYEEDDRAYVIIPYIPNVNRNIEKMKAGMNMANDKTLQRWLSDAKYYHVNKSRAISNLDFGFDNKKVHFMDVPEDRYDEFLERYYNSGVEDSDTYEFKSIMETVRGKFRMFLDVDYIAEDEMSDSIANRLLNVIYDYGNEYSDIYVTKSVRQYSDKGIKTGLHIVLPDLHVDIEYAKSFRQCVVDTLDMLVGDHDGLEEWETMIDDIYYEDGSGTLRMFGSKKPHQRGVMNCLHEFYLMIDRDCTVTKPIIDLDIFKRLSIKIPKM
jgi:predicted kinase